MVFPIVGGTQDTSYEIENSLRFNDDDDARLTRSVSGNLSKAHTFSLWIKRANLKASGRHILAAMGDGSGDISWLELNNDRIAMLFDGAGNYFPKTDAVLRDSSAWYHIVVTVDSTQGTASNRCKFYLNGTQLTDTSGTNPPQDHQAAMDACTIGYNSGDEFDGYMAEFHFLDGVAYDPTYFGKTNENGVWIPKKYTGGNYGTNGFYFEFKQTGTSANSSGMGADTSGNDNHFSATNLAATDVTVDTPTNNFATLNPLSAKTLTFSEGNLHATNDGAAGSATGTIAPTNGKWYFEITLSGSANFAAGVVNLDDWASGTDIYSYGEAAAVLIESNANYNVTYGNTASSPSTLQTGTQLLNATYGFAMNIDNNDLYVSANGNWYTGSAFDNTSFSSASAVTTDLPSNVPLTAFIRNPDSGTAQCNFGNPAISISSGNSDANGYGNFEYAVPSGYFALCTKNLAEFG